MPWKAVQFREFSFLSAILMQFIPLLMAEFASRLHDEMQAYTSLINTNINAFLRTNHFLSMCYKFK